tara:strand:- start:2506 stop:2925 length:420 start_codon:yes stop_codon:yes gene_type:complete
MDKKGGWDLIKSQVIYLIIVVLFFLGMFFFVQSQLNGASIWEDFYAKDIVKVINGVDSGTEIERDVHKATEIAQSNDLLTYSEIFTYDNKENDFCVKLGKGRKTCYKWFNDVNIVELDLKLASPDKNILVLRVEEGEDE